MWPVCLHCNSYWASELGCGAIVVARRMQLPGPSLGMVPLLVALFCVSARHVRSPGQQTELSWIPQSFHICQLRETLSWPDVLPFSFYGSSQTSSPQMFCSLPLPLLSAGRSMTSAAQQSCTMDVIYFLNEHIRCIDLVEFSMWFWQCTGGTLPSALPQPTCHSEPHQQFLTKQPKLWWQRGSC